MRRNTYSGAGIALIALLIGVLLGWGFRSTMAPGNNLPLSNFPIAGIGGGPDSSGIGGDNQLSLNNLFVQHAVLVTLHLQEIYDGKNTSASSQQLSNNGQQIATLVGDKYGTNAKNSFLSLWQNHITEYENYTRALKNNDANAMSTAKSNLASISSDMGKFLNKLDPTISATQVTNMMSDHVMLTLSIIDAYASNDSVTMDKQIKTASDQATLFAAYLTQSSSPTQPPTY